MNRMFFSFSQGTLAAALALIPCAFLTQGCTEDALLAGSSSGTGGITNTGSGAGGMGSSTSTDSAGTSTTGTGGGGTAGGDGTEGSGASGGGMTTTSTGASPTCDDGVQNQDETAVDCGGVCPACCTDYSITQTSGVKDDFDPGNGTESPSPSSGLSAILGGGGSFGLRDYDSVGYDQFFAHTFTGLAPAAGTVICGAQMTLQILCKGSNDTLGLRFVDPMGIQDPDAIYGHFLAEAPWDVLCNPGSPMTLTLDLANLPPNGNLSNLIPKLNEHGFVDVFIQDDTAVDFITLDVSYCCE